jgi:1,3-beta-glucanosyltransferase GAS1
MKSFGMLSGLASLSLLGLASAASAATAGSTLLDPIVVKGSKFFYKTNGTQFFIRGVAYQRKFATVCLDAY